MKPLTVIALCMITISCASNEVNETTHCRGEFRFEGIQAPLKADAFRTIIQFTELDEGIEAVLPLSPSQERLEISGRGSQCSKFGRSFLASDMPEFRGLAYRALPYE